VALPPVGGTAIFPAVPLIHVQMAAGRDKKTKQDLLFAIAKAVEETGVPKREIRVWITEFPEDEYVVQGELLTDLHERLDTEGEAAG
jgi:4-oxalocrotonate tautomerase family enzyme